MSKVNTKSKVSKHFYDSKESVVITSDIWKRDPDYPVKFLPHVGYDYRASTGTKLVACFDGVIVNAVTGLGSSYGRQVFLYNEALNVTAHYAHFSSVSVKTGQTVKKGELLGLSGRSGAEENTYDAHLHFGLGNGKITNAGAKGNDLGDIWLDVEEFDFDTKQKQVLVLPASLGDTIPVYSYAKGEKVGTLNPKKFGGLEYDILETTGNGDRIIVTQDYGKVRINPKYGSIKGESTTTATVSNIGKYWTNKNTPLKLYNDKGVAYTVPSNAVRKYLVLAENKSLGLIQISHGMFSPNKVWVKVSDGNIQ